MDFSIIENFSQRELEQFKSVCNKLLSSTFVTKKINQPPKGIVDNPDYRFLLINKSIVEGYLSLLDWRLYHNDTNGFFYVDNSNETNRLNLDKISTAILLALRLIYDENYERAGLDHDVICTVRDLLEKLVTDYAIMSAKPNMKEVKKYLTVFDNHFIIQKVEGKYNEYDCKFTILPTILIAVSAEKLESIVSTLKEEERDNEKIEEDNFD